MTEPQIQYARTADGVSVAYALTGNGPPLLYCPNVLMSLQHVLSDGAPSDTAVGVVVGLATRTRMTILDPPGTGASQRDVSDFSLDAQVRAIEAVAARVAERPFTLVGHNQGATVGALYAARHPEQVRRLACVYPMIDPDLTRDRAAYMRENWAMFRRYVADRSFPEGPVSSQRWVGQAIRESVSAEVAAAYFEEYARTDVTEIYRQVPVPTLVCAWPRQPERSAAIAFASLVPDCRVVPGYDSQVADAILEFMGVDVAQVVASPAPSQDARGTVIILYADIADSTALTERMGDAAFRERARKLDGALRGIVRDNGGTAIDGKLVGDGIMATFLAASQAIVAALAYEGAARDAGLGLHVGLHAGDVIREADPGGQSNVYGGAVNIAARISALAPPGEVLVSRTVRDLARTSAGVVFEDRGEHALKGVSEAQRVYAVRKAEA